MDKTGLAKPPSEFEAALAEAADALNVFEGRDGDRMNELLRETYKAGGRWARAHTLQSSEVRGLVNTVRLVLEHYEVPVQAGEFVLKNPGFKFLREALAAYDHAVRTEGE